MVEARAIAPAAEAPSLMAPGGGPSGLFAPIPLGGAAEPLSAPQSARPARPRAAFRPRLPGWIKNPFASASGAVAAGEPPARFVYVLSRPMEATVKLGVVAKAVHYGGETAMQIGKAGAVYYATGEPYAAASVLVFELLKMPPMVMAQSMADLQARYWWHKLKRLRALARIPGVERIQVLTTGEVEFQGLLAHRQDSRGLVFLETSSPLSAPVAPEHGAALPVEDLAKTRVRLSLVLGEHENPVSWRPALGEFLGNRVVPAAIAAAWRKDVREFAKEKTWFKRVFDYSRDKKIKIDAALIDADGTETPLGTLSRGKSARKILGATFARRLIPFWKGAIPLSDTAVARGGPDGRSWARKALEFPGRLIRRLLGKLIVV